MKLTSPISLIAAISTLGLAAAYGQAEQTQPSKQAEKTTESTTKTDGALDPTTVATGIVFSITTDELAVTPEKATIPITYSYVPGTPLIDEAEKPVPWDLLRTGVPVTVQYYTLGEKFVATKVIVTRKMLVGGDVEGAAPAVGATAQKREALLKEKMVKDEAVAERQAERARTTPVASEGTILGFEQVIAIRAQGSTDVVQYAVNNSTHFLDKSGQPVPFHVVRTGVPVSIQFVEDSGRRIATRITVDVNPEGRQEGVNVADGRTGTSSSGGLVSPTGGVAGVVPGALAEGLIYPPVNVLPVNPGVQPGQTNQPGNVSGTQPAAQPGSQPAVPSQPGTNQPATPQPGNKQPDVKQPGNKQPATPPAGSRPGNGTGSGSSNGGTSGGGSSAPQNPGGSGTGNR